MLTLLLAYNAYITFVLLNIFVSLQTGLAFR